MFLLLVERFLTLSGELRRRLHHQKTLSKSNVLHLEPIFVNRSHTDLVETARARTDSHWSVLPHFSLPSLAFESRRSHHWIFAWHYFLKGHSPPVFKFHWLGSLVLLYGVKRRQRSPLLGYWVRWHSFGWYLGVLVSFEKFSDVHGWL